MAEAFSRRRFIGISAAAAGLGLVRLADVAEAQAELVTWRGIALGAVATLHIHHHDRVAAERLIARAIAEVRQLEGLFSLYRDDTCLATLNRCRALVAPPEEFVQLLEDCMYYARLTGGAFDPTVQPLWTLYAGHFSQPGADPAGPSDRAVAEALSRVGHQHLVISRDRIAFLRRGMSLTLNGIAQGFITDRVVALLKAGGIDTTLVDMGETRVLGSHPSGRPWQAGITDPEQPDRIAATVPLRNQALATSGAYGFRFDPAGRINHLFDPKTGRSASRYASVTVVMPTATAADALSTAFSVMTVDEIERTLESLGSGFAYLMTREGTRVIAAWG